MKLIIEKQLINVDLKYKGKHLVYIYLSKFCVIFNHHKYILFKNITKMKQKNIE